MPLPRPTTRRTIVGLAITPAVFAACGPAPTGQGDASSAQPVKVRIMGTFVDQTQGETLWKQWKAEIAEKEKGVDAEFVVQPQGGNVPDKLLAMVAAGHHGEQLVRHAAALGLDDELGVDALLLLGDLRLPLLPEGLALRLIDEGAHDAHFGGLGGLGLGLAGGRGAAGGEHDGDGDCTCAKQSTAR